MNHALVIFDDPPIDKQPEWQQWKDILTSLENATHNNENIQKIHENIWLFAWQNELPVFVHTLADSDNKNLKYHVLFFEEYSSFSPPT